MTHQPVIAYSAITNSHYLACECGWGHLVGEDDIADHIGWVDAERIVRERLADLRSCDKDDDCQTKADGVELALSDVEYERKQAVAA